jgi:hypothetical protein
MTSTPYSPSSLGVWSRRNKEGSQCSCGLSSVAIRGNDTRKGPLLPLIVISPKMIRFPKLLGSEVTVPIGRRRCPLRIRK